MLHHPLDPADLALDTGEPREQLVLACAVTAHRWARWFCHARIVPLPPMGMLGLSRDGRCPRSDLARSAGLLPDGVGGVVGARARLCDLWDRAGVGAASAHRACDVRLGAQARRAGPG